MSTLRIPTLRAFTPLLEPARYKGAHGGRGSAKSHFFADNLIDEVLSEPTRAVCLREVQKSLDQSVKRLLEDKIIAYSLGRHFDVQRREIHVDNGGLIIFQGMQDHTAESIKSLEGYRIAWTEEAQSLSQRSLDLLRPTLRAPRSEMWFSWNPRLATDPIDVLLRGPDGPPPNSIVIGVNWRDNKFFPEELRVDMEWDRSRDIDKYMHIWEGHYQKNSEARVFQNWRVEHFETPPKVRFLFGGDWGFSVDPTVLVRAFIDGRRLFVDYEAYQIGCPIDHTPGLFRTIPEAQKWPITADSARPETIDYMRRHGFPRIRPAVKGPGSVEEGIQFLKNYDIVVHPRCVHTIDELTMFSWKVDRLTGQILPILDDKKNHVIDSLRYAAENVRRGSYTLEGVA